MFERVQKVFFVGIGGIGISAIARMFLLQGKEVAGSDLSASELTDELARLGAKVSIGQGIELVPENVDLIVYTAALETYAAPFLTEIKDFGTLALSYPEVLREISKSKFTIAVAGTHGKTTTTAMVSKILVDAGLDPTAIVGSLFSFGSSSPSATSAGERSNFIAGKGNYFVIEADEYRRAFHHLSPSILAINNIDEDHLDYYKDLADIQRAFSELAAKVPESGFVVTNREDPHVSGILGSVKAPVLHYPEANIEGLTLKVFGEHNRRNAQVALCIAEALGVDREKAKQSLAEFQGTARRFEYKGTMANGAIVYDDYAHNPEKVKAAIAGAREAFKDKKITVVFQPHLYSRTKHHLAAFARALTAADSVMLTPIFAARENVDPSITSEMVADEIKKTNPNVSSMGSFEEIAERLRRSTSERDVIIIMGAGDIYKVATMLLG